MSLEGCFATGKDLRAVSKFQDVNLPYALLLSTKAFVNPDTAVLRFRYSQTSNLDILIVLKGLGD